MAKQTKPKKKPSKKASARGRKSRRKGATGELELAHFLTDHGIPAERGVQHAGGVESADIKILTDFPFHIECKRVESGSIYKWMAQASADAGNKIPMVQHRRNGQRWLTILYSDDFFTFKAPQ
jgi:hypothetical protein